MNLNTITEVKRPASAEEITQWRDGYAWLAGGTWLFSEPQVATDTLIDLEQLQWPALQATPAGLEIAATCRIMELARFTGPPEWRATPLMRECCDAFLASFKIWNVATVGGNICMRGFILCGRATPRRATFRPWTSSPATTPTCCSRANCCAVSTCRRRRCRSGSPSGMPRSPISAARRRC